MKKSFIIVGILSVVATCYVSYLIGSKIENNINERKEKSQT